MDDGADWRRVIEREIATLRTEVATLANENRNTARLINWVTGAGVASGIFLGILAPRIKSLLGL